MTPEKWIWTELLAFDNAAPDYGVAAYLGKCGVKPYGISLLLPHVDFILQHDGRVDGSVLPPDICSRCAHPYNEERERQEWTRSQIAGLVRELRGKDIRVFLSIFRYFFKDLHHREWQSGHPGVGMLSRFPDGTYFEDFFVGQLERTIIDYGFDGWHSADDQGPSGPITDCYRDDDIFLQFTEKRGWAGIPEEFRSTGRDEAFAARRFAWLWAELKFEWMEFISSRWLSLHGKAAAMLHRHGRQLMMNSACAKAAFESRFYFGLDTAKLPEIGLDYLMVEMIATGGALLYHYQEEVFDQYVSVADLAAALPGVKLITLTGVKDVVESYASLRHVPSRFERDFYIANNQMQALTERDRRCVSGFLVCLGDALPENEWRMIDRFAEQTFAFPLQRSGGMLWLSDTAIRAELGVDHARYGTPPAYQAVSALLRHGVDVNTVVRAEDLAAFPERPLLAAHLDLQPPEVRELLLSRPGFTVLLGNFDRIELPAGASSLTWRAYPGYLYGCAVLNGRGGMESLQLEAPPAPPFDSARHFMAVENRCPMLPVPEAFWDACAEWLRRARPEAEMPENLDGWPLFMLRQYSPAGTLRTALLSDDGNYLRPRVRFPAGCACRPERVSAFPCHPLKLRPDGVLSCEGDENWACGILVIPPRGLFLFDCQAE